MNIPSCKHKIGTYTASSVCLKSYFFRVKTFRTDEAVSGKVNLYSAQSVYINLMTEKVLLNKSMQKSLS